MPRDSEPANPVEGVFAEHQITNLPTLNVHVICRCVVDCTCVKAIKSGRKTCPSGSLPAAEIERVVGDRIRCIASDKKLRAEVVRKAKAITVGDLAELKQEHRGLQRDLARYDAEIRKLVADQDSHADARIADLHGLVGHGERRLAEVCSEIREREREQFDDQDLADGFADFDATWKALSPREQAQALALLVARVEYDGEESTVAVSFHDSGIRTLARGQRKEAACSQ